MTTVKIENITMMPESFLVIRSSLFAPHSFTPVINFRLNSDLLSVHNTLDLPFFRVCVQLTIMRLICVDVCISNSFFLKIVLLRFNWYIVNYTKFTF